MSELVRFLSGDNDVAQKTQMDPQNPTAKFVPLEPGQVLFGLEVVEDGSLLGTIYYDYKDKNGIITRVSMGNGGAGGSGSGGGIIKTLATTDGKHESDEVTATANTIIPLPKKIFANLLSAKTQFNFPKVHDPSNTAYVNEDAAPGQSYLYGNGLHMINPFNTLQDSWIRTIGKSGSAEATLELAMRDNASNEYIYDQIVARHYKADGTIVTDTDGHKREVVILGKEGESQFPGPVTSQRGFVGDVDGNAKSATKAKQDWYDQVIDSTYLSKIVKTTHNGSKFEITSYDGRYTPVGSADAKKDVITIPGATTTLAGLVTTGDQTITGNKTINSSGTLTIMKQGGFIYSGIQEDKATNKNLPIWFSTGTANGTPNYSTELTYNPSTGTVTAKKFAGPATSATYDAEGGAIHDKYLKRAGGTMTGALNFADNTYNAFGDDVEIGSQNAAGKLNIHGKNGATGIVFVPYSGSTSQTISIDGAGVMTITGTVKTTLKGNADTATTLKTARNFNITDSSAAYSGPNVSFNGSADVTLHMPDTFAGTLKGNADTATKLKTARTLWGQSFNGTANISGNMTGVGNVTSTKTNTYTLGTSSNLWKAVYATTFYGALSGNANTATKLQTARSFHITDSSATYNGVSTTFDGSAAITLHMPDTFVGTLKGNADSATKATWLQGPDTRTANDAPSVYMPKYPRGIYPEFKQNSSLNSIPGGDIYSYVVTYVPWNDSSGGRPVQMSFNTGALAWRSATSDSTWGAWKTLIHSSNYANYTVKKDGTGATGTWSINITGSASSATTAGSAGSATKDHLGNIIADTYLKRYRLVNSIVASDTNGVLPPAIFAYMHGYPMNTDPEFSSGNNGISVYDNNASGKTTITRIDLASGNSSGKALEIRNTGTGPSPNLGGWYFGNMTANARQYTCVFRAKVPAGYKIGWHSNSIGTGGTNFWLTDNAGTGKWEWYAYHVACGNGGNSSTMFFALEGTAGTSSAPVIWYLSYANTIINSYGNYDGLRTRYADNATNATASTTATKWATARNFQVDLALDNPSTVKVDGSKDVILPVTGILATKHGGTGNSSHTANRLVWSETATKLSATNNHYVDATHIAVNHTSLPSYNFHVAGTSYLDGNATISAAHALLFTATTGGTTVNTPMALTYGRLQSYGTLAINADTDGSKTEYLILTAGRGMSNSTSDGLTVGYEGVGIKGYDKNYTLYVGGTTYHTQNIFIPNDVAIHQHQGDTSNYTTLIRWLKNKTGWTYNNSGTQTAYKYQPQIGQHNTGGDGFGSVTILPYATNSEPWGKTVGLYITKNLLQLDNCRIPTTGNTTGTVGSTTQPVYVSAGVIKPTSYYLKSSVDAGTANRMAYFSATNVVNDASTIYANNTQLGINTTSMSTPKLIWDLAATQVAETVQLQVSGKSYFTNTVILESNKRAIEFRPGHESYNSYIYYGTSGNEALNFVNKQAVTSFIFWTGDSVNSSNQWYLQEDNTTARTNNPALQVKQNSVYINKLLPSGTAPSYKLYVNGTSYFSDLMTVSYGASHKGIKVGNTYINAINGDLILQNNGAIRFGTDSWDYNCWAGLKYDHTNKKIAIGLADGTEFTTNSAQSGGRITTAGISAFNVGPDIIGTDVHTKGKKGVMIGYDASNGKIELSGVSPYIDFHHDNTQTDYTGRIISKTELVGSESRYGLLILPRLGVNDINYVFNLSVKGNQGITAAANRTMTLDTANSNKIGTATGDLHIQPVSVGSGSAITNGNVSAITFGCNNIAYAGIYSPASGSYGNHLIFATTGSYANGAYGRMIITAGGLVGIGTMSPIYKLHVTGDIYANGGWLRTSGAYGWYSETYGGGWYMTDSNFIRNYNSKAVSINIASNNAWGIGSHRLAAVFKGNDHVSILLSTNTLGYGLCVNNNGNWYWGKRTSSSETSTSGDTYLLQGNTTLVRPATDMAIGLGQVKSAEFSNAFIRAISTRHLDASGVYSGDMHLYIGYGSNSPTQKTLFYYSTGTHGAAATSRTQFAEINSNGLYALTRFGVNGQNTSYNFYVNGTSYLSGNANVCKVYNTANYGDSSSVTLTQLAAYNNASCGMIHAATDNPRGAAGWVHVWSQAWQHGVTSSWVSQIALNVNDGAGMWYRTTSGNIAGRAWIRVLDTNNYASVLDSRYVNATGDTMTGLLSITTHGVTTTYGCQNASYNHFSTTASVGHWFNKNVYVQGNIYAGSSYSDLVLTTANYASQIDSRYVNVTGDTMTGMLRVNNAPIFGYRYGQSNNAPAFVFDKSGSNYTGIGANGSSDTIYFGAVSSDGNWNWVTSYKQKWVFNGTVTADQFNGPSTSANYLNINNSANCAYGLQYIQTSAQTAGGDLPTSTWWHVIKMNHGNGDTYYKRLLAFNFWTGNDIRTGNADGDGKVDAWYKVWCQGNSVTGAVWNDYAECRESDTQEAGYVLAETGKDNLVKTTERLQHFAGVSSDTWGFSQGETEKAKTPIAVAGRVLVYPYQDRNNYQPGDCVCAAPGGTVDIMTREEVIRYPDRIVGTVSCVPNYEEWGGGEGADRDPVKVNGRIWIKVR